MGPSNSNNNKRARDPKKKTTGSQPSNSNNNKRARDPKKQLRVVSLLIVIIINAHATRKNKKLRVVSLVIVIIINAHATRKKKTTGSQPSNSNNNKRARDPKKKNYG